MAEKTSPTRIQLKGFNVHEEGRAAATITPGMLLALNSSGNLIPHGVADGRAERMFALEDALQGRTIEDDYASGELVQVGIGKPGDHYYGWLAAGQTCSPGDSLSSNGDGTLRVVNAGTDFEVGVALEAVDLTDTGAANGRVRLRIV